MLHLTAAFRPCPPHERFTTGTIEGAWSNLNTGNQNDDWGKLVPSSQKRRKFRHFRKGNQSILEGIPIPDLLIVSRCLYQVGNTCY